MTNIPLVSVGVASYNNSNYVIDTLESIRDQSYQNIEIIIVDDCSKDDSVSKIEKWIADNSNLSIKFIKHEKNKGIPKVFNEILHLAIGQYLAIIGSDDLFKYNRIEKQVAFFSEHPEVSMCFSDMYMIDEKGNLQSDSYFSQMDESTDTIKEFLFFSKEKKIERLILKNVLPAPSFMFVTQHLLDMSGWDESLYFEDWDMNLRLIYNDRKIGFLNDALVSYRILSTSANRKPNTFYYSSVLKSLYKYRRISKEIDNAINVQLKFYSFLLYANNGKGASKWFLKLLKAEKKPKYAFYFAYSFYKEFIRRKQIKFMSAI